MALNRNREWEWLFRCINQENAFALFDSEFAGVYCYAWRCSSGPAKVRPSNRMHPSPSLSFFLSPLTLSLSLSFHLMLMHWATPYDYGIAYAIETAVDIDHPSVIRSKSKQPTMVRNLITYNLRFKILVVDVDQVILVVIASCETERSNYYERDLGGFQ